jgi:hypothetical protein
MNSNWFKLFLELFLNLYQSNWLRVLYLNIWLTWRFAIFIYNWFCRIFLAWSASIRIHLIKFMEGSFSIIEKSFRIYVCFLFLFWDLSRFIFLFYIIIKLFLELVQIVLYNLSYNFFCSLIQLMCYYKILY